MKIPVGEIIPLLEAIARRDWDECSKQEMIIANKYGSLRWEYVALNQVLPVCGLPDITWILLESPKLRKARKHPAFLDFSYCHRYAMDYFRHKA